MDSSLNDTTEIRTSLGADCDKLLELCMNPYTHHETIGATLRTVMLHQIELQDSAEFWLLRAMAIELHRPSSAPRFVPRIIERAEDCPDIEQFKCTYAEWRVEALERRLERSSASIGHRLRYGYELRLTVAKSALREIPQPVNNGN